MMTSDDKVGGWVKKGQNHDDVILECPLRQLCTSLKPPDVVGPRAFEVFGHNW